VEVSIHIYVLRTSYRGRVEVSIHIYVLRTSYRGRVRLSRLLLCVVEIDL